MSSIKPISRSDPSNEHFRKEDYPFYWIAHVHGVYTSKLEQALKPIGIDIPSWRILFCLREGTGPLSISEIAEHAIGKLSTITKIVYRMKLDDLVDTATADYDGRVTQVVLTDRGRAIIKKIEIAISGVVKSAFKDMSSEQIHKINVLLQMILLNLKDEGDAGRDAVGPRTTSSLTASKAKPGRAACQASKRPPLRNQRSRGSGNDAGRPKQSGRTPS